VGTGLGKLDTDSSTGQIIGGAIDVQPYLAPGMPNHTYEVCLEALEASAQEAATGMSSDRSDTSGASVSPLLTF
jgi:hypothetical protein